MLVLQRLFSRTWLFQEQIGHALPILHHGVGLNEGVDEVRSVFVQLRLDEKLNQVTDQGRVPETNLSSLGPHVWVNL